VNALAKGHKFTAVGLLEVSPDGTKLAYSVDLKGFRQYELYVKISPPAGRCAKPSSA
jgi:oligopeptidase B